MADNTSSLQWEGDKDGNLTPGQFLREIDNKIDNRNITDEAKKIKTMQNNIAFGSDADDWFNALDPTEKDTYEHLTEAFVEQWPLTPAPKASKSERIKALKEWTLKVEDLGKRVDGPGGTSIWSHVKWANGLSTRVRDAEDSTGFLISEVYGNLPRPVRELIRTKPRTTYQELSSAVLALDTSDLKDAAVEHNRNEETARLAREPASPTKAIREALASTHMQIPQRQYIPTAPPFHNTEPQRQTPLNPFREGGGRGSLFGPARGAAAPFRGTGPGALGMGRGAVRPNLPTMPPLRDRPIMQRHQDLLQFALPHHPDTPEGRAAYRTQTTTWHAANPNRMPDEQHQYPLIPGTSPIGSRECWDCGQTGHMQGASVCGGASLPEPERDWRRVAGYITHEFNKERLVDAQSVNYMGYNEYNPYPQYAPRSNYATYPSGNHAGELDDGQGKGGGPST